jgi:hypothetical protein
MTNVESTYMISIPIFSSCDSSLIINFKMPSLNPTHIDDSRWEHGNVFIYEAQEVRIHYIDSPPQG